MSRGAVETSEPLSEACAIPANPTQKPVLLPHIAHQRRLCLTLQERNVDADARHRGDEPSNGANQRHVQSRHVGVRWLVVRVQDRLLRGDLADLRDMVVLMRPDLSSRFVLVMHHTYAFGCPDIYLECAKPQLKAVKQTVAVYTHQALRPSDRQRGSRRSRPTDLGRVMKHHLGSVRFLLLLSRRSYRWQKARATRRSGRRSAEAGARA